MGRDVQSHASQQPLDCDACGAAAVGGRSGCRLLLDNLMARAQSDERYGRAYRLAFDAYCMQHPDEFVEWPQSYWSIPRWLNGSRDLQKPAVLSARGVMTIADVAGAITPEEHTRQVRARAECVWRAYQSQHALARGWLQKALSD